MSGGVIVAIDGPSGVGKTTTSRRVAEALGVPHIDTGAMYRAIALSAQRKGVAFDDGAALRDLANGSVIDFRSVEGASHTYLDGEDVEREIRRPDMSMAASTVSAVPEVRRVLVELQQRLGHSRGGVLEGRDIGTKVFPATPHKFFLTARPEVRADRRYGELTQRGISADPAVVLGEMVQRDLQDSTRSDSPMTWDESYRVIDTSDLTLDEVVSLIVQSVRTTSP